ncbi:protein-glutamine glutaminase family protein [Oligoflexus tunisiensis]|uniref:protein-glutamine glutaminase family protein n=1 Tax=Oligoflexus tunisiensis TaxID=708132 RepID=UPI00114C8A2D|nr:protein-glutamine glutaminase family protein [Oligoflexus tunisiensis]
MRKQLLFFSLLTLTACGQQSRQTSDTSALVSQQQATQAFSIVKAIDYLPFTFIEDGCYARSLYMSLELASQRIPSSALYVYGVLQPTPSVSWSYHVAPMIQVTNSAQEAWVLDPAFEREPLTRSQWLNKNFAASSKSEIKLENIALYTKTRIRAGSAYFEESGRTDPYDTPETRAFDAASDSEGDVVGLIPRPINKSVLIPNFEEMPTFLSGDIHSACTVMYDYIYRERLSEPDEKVEKLLASTTRLIKAMDSLDKLTRNGVSSYWGEAAKDCSAAMSGYYK